MRRLSVVFLIALSAAACDDDSNCDQCGVCDDQPDNDCGPDCEGTFGGTARLDNCGVCVEGNTGKTACAFDCAGVENGSATVDKCGTCDDNPDNDCQQDCAGRWGGWATVDECGVCDTDPSNDCEKDCNGVWGGAASLDKCDVCDDDPSNDCTQDCAGVWGGDGLLDRCSVCDDDPSNDCQQDCDGVWGGVMTEDRCGVCDADPTNDDTTCTEDCNGQWGGTAELDDCGVCAGGTTGVAPCVADCNGDAGGSATLDECGTCDDDPSNDCVQDCAEVWGGLNLLDECGVCDDNPANDCIQDCKGIWGGDNTLDACGTCDNDPSNDCVQDCTGGWGPPGSTAVFDACGACVGGGTGAVACVNWCEPFTESMTNQIHPFSDDPAAYRNHVASGASPTGYVDELLETEQLQFEGTLTLPPGQWAVAWRIAGGTDRFPLTLKVSPDSPADCTSETTETWEVDDQPAAGAWGTSPEVQVTVTGTSACIVGVSLSNTEAGEVKKGYAFNLVHATPLCAGGEEALCPAVPGATASCVDDRCVYTAGDADGDGLCDAVDRCDQGDDTVDADHDGAPAACDCNDADPTIHPAAMEICGGGDNDCNGLDAEEEGAFVRHVSLTGLTLEPADKVVVAGDPTSIFSSSVSIPGSYIGQITLSGGPATYLRPGRYVADFSAMKGLAALELKLAVNNAAGRDCLTPAQTTWQPANFGVWEQSPTLAFEVTGATCPAHFSVSNAQAVNKMAWFFDWVRLRHACDVDEDCPAYADATASCTDNVCEYDYEGAVCEP